MKIQNVLAAFSLIILSACSSAPSDSEIKNAVLARAEIDNCRYISIEDFKKINGIASADGRNYQIDFEFTLKVAPLPDAEKLQSQIATRNTDDVIQLEKAKTELADFEKANQGKSLTDDEVKLKSALRKTLNAANYDVSYKSNRDVIQIEERYSLGCSKVSGFANGFISRLHSTNKEWFKSGTEKKITNTLNFIKTDNGWMPS